MCQIWWNFKTKCSFIFSPKGSAQKQKFNKSKQRFYGGALILKVIKALGTRNFNFSWTLLAQFFAYKSIENEFNYLFIQILLCISIIRDSDINMNNIWHSQEFWNLRKIYTHLNSLYLIIDINFCETLVRIFNMYSGLDISSLITFIVSSQF